MLTWLALAMANPPPTNSYLTSPGHGEPSPDQLLPD